MTRFAFFGLVFGFAFTANAQNVFTMGDVVVVKDTTGSITHPPMFPGLQMSFCRDAYNQARTLIGDDFDGVISFSTTNTWMDMENTWQGFVVRNSTQGIRESAGANPFANGYNGQKLGQCVFMGTLGTTAAILGASEPLPADPDAISTAGFPLPIPGLADAFGLTGIEMLGHEYGHHWLMGVQFDKGTGQGKQTFIRGAESTSSESDGEQYMINYHYSAWADSRSVMYGSCINAKGNGQYEQTGCVRKYSEIDQYLMGLREPADVTPMLVLHDGSGYGNGSQPVSKKAQPTMLSGMQTEMVSADDLIRAMGPRVPSVANAQKCWRVAFIVVLEPGQNTVPPAMLKKIEAYQQRWPNWFKFATDGRGSMDVRLTGNGCVTNYQPPLLDGGVSGVVPFDAGTTPVVDPPDASVDEVDAGPVEQIDQDAGVDPMPGQPDVEHPDVCLDCDNLGTVRDGCSCNAGAPGAALMLLGLLAIRRMRRR